PWRWSIPAGSSTAWSRLQAVRPWTRITVGALAASAGMYQPLTWIPASRLGIVAVSGAGIRYGVVSKPSWPLTGPPSEARTSKRVGSFDSQAGGQSPLTFESLS